MTPEEKALKLVDDNEKLSREIETLKGEISALKTENKRLNDENQNLKRVNGELFLKIPTGQSDQKQNSKPEKIRIEDILKK